MSETNKLGPTGGRKAQQTRLAQWLAFALSLIVIGMFYQESTTLAKANVETDTLALILSDFKWVAGMAFAAVAGQLAVFTAGNAAEHKAKAQQQQNVT